MNKLSIDINKYLTIHQVKQKNTKPRCLECIKRIKR
jgi:hypothetical protein